LVARPWGEANTNRGKGTPTVDFKGNPLWLQTDQQIVDTVHSIARSRGVSMAQVAMAWVLKNPVVDAPIVGATKTHHLCDAVAALGLVLTDDEVGALESPMCVASRPGSDRPHTYLPAAS
jgi:aryl-alcohol dehydrogenase-like predicted oxidoreductase